MALSVLNNIPSLVAQNQLQVTNENLQNTLFQLSSGSRINSGADDPAGLSIVNGLQANISALTQSSQNATDGVGQLQVADGALSQVTTLLNRAVTLATEAANGGLTAAQFSAVTNEYSSITNEINRIGNATNFNGTSVFQAANVANPNQVATTATSSLGVNSTLTSGATTTVQLGNNPAYTYTAGASATTLLGSAASLTAATTIATGKTISITNTGGAVNFTAALQKWGNSGTAVTAATALTAGDNVTVTSTGGAAVNFTAVGGNTVATLMAAINGSADANVKAYIDSSGNLTITSAANDNLTVTENAGATTRLGTMTGTLDTVGDLMNQINTSAFGMTASLTAAGNFQVTSSNGAISVSNNNMTTPLGTVAATNTIQDLINGINASGLGVTASLVSIANPNQLRGATASLTGATAITAGQSLTITSGTRAANGSYANTFTYTASATTPDTVLNTPGNTTVQGLIDAINTSGTPFHAFLDTAGHLQITDSSYSGNIAATGTVTGETGALAEPAATTQLVITDAQNRGDLTATNNDTGLGYVANTGGNPLEGGNADSFVAPAETGSGGATVFISDGQVGSQYNTLVVPVGLLSSSQIGSNATTLATQNLGTASGAASALTVINNAISDVAAMRGTIGAGVNRLNAATNVINTQIQNLTSARSSMQDANVGQVIANLSKYQVLEQTGISALAQANQNEQVVLKLLQ